MIEKLLKSKNNEDEDEIQRIPNIPSVSLESLLKEINKDAKHINESENGLDTISLYLPIMHAKYISLYSNECVVLSHETERLRVLKNYLWEYYVTGADLPIVKKYGWVMPTDSKGGKVLKAEAPFKIATNKDVVSQTLKVGEIQHKVDIIKEQLTNIKSIRFDIKNAIEFKKWQTGD